MRYLLPALLILSPSAAFPYQALLRKGDVVFNVLNHVPQGQGVPIASDYTLKDLKVGQAVLVDKADHPHPALIFFGDVDGHVAIAHGGAFVEPIPDPNIPNYPGAAIYLSQGAVSISEAGREVAYRIRRKKRPRLNSTRVIVRTKATSTGAKGTLVTVSYLPEVGTTPGKTVVSNFETRGCDIFWNDLPYSPTNVARGWTWTFVEPIGPYIRARYYKPNLADPQMVNPIGGGVRAKKG